LRARIAQAIVVVSEARAELASAIGGLPSPDELAAADELAEPAGDTRQVALLVRRALERRHEVAASRLQSGAAEARVRATRKRYLPEPELGIGYSRWTNVAGLPSSSVGGALLASASLPLPFFDRGQGTIQREIEQSSAARVRERDTKNVVQREVELALRKLRLTSGAYVAFRQEASPQASQVRKIAEVTYREGRGTILELLDAYSSYLRIEEQALELRGAALASAVELQQAIGPE
jgi:outer membrane protein, heavy metal efflux system